MSNKVKNFIILSLGIVLIVVAGFVAMFSTDSIRQVKAEETTNTLTYKQLFTVTNTYNCTYAEYYGDSAYLSYTVGTSNTPTQKGQQVYNSSADITVFTHGWTADDTSWGNESYTFINDEGEAETGYRLDISNNTLVYQLAQAKKPPIGGFFY